MRKYISFPLNASYGRLRQETQQGSQRGWGVSLFGVYTFFRRDLPYPKMTTEHCSFQAWEFLHFAFMPKYSGFSLVFCTTGKAVLQTSKTFA